MRLRFAVLAAACVVLPSRARADEQGDASCLASFEQTQRQRMSGKLVDARDTARACAVAQCPPVLRKDCAAWAEELELSIPTVVLVVRGAKGDDVDARIEIDGVEVPNASSGRALPLDPGKHIARAVSRGEAEKTRSFLLREGDKRARIEIVLEEAAVSTPKSTSAVPLGTWIAGGIGIASLATGAVFWLDGHARRDSIDASGCKPNCDVDRYDAMKRNVLVGDVLVGASVIAAAVAVVLYLTRPESTPRATITGAAR